MSVVIPVTFNLSVTGTNVSTYKEIIEFDLYNKYENSFTILDTDGEITLDFSNIENPKMLMFNGDGDFIIKLTDVGANEFVLTNDGTVPTVIQTEATFYTTYPTITVSTISTTDVEINVRAYGEETA